MTGMKKMTLPAAALTGVAAGTVSTLVLTAVPALLLNGGVIDPAMARGSAFVAEGIAMFLSACFCIRARGRQALPVALSMGGGVFLLSLILCLSLSGTEGFSSWIGSQLLSCFVGPVCGAFYSNRQNAQKKHKRRRK